MNDTFTFFLLVCSDKNITELRQYNTHYISLISTFSTWNINSKYVSDTSKLKISIIRTVLFPFSLLCSTSSSLRRVKNGKNILWTCFLAGKLGFFDRHWVRKGFFKLNAYSKSPYTRYCSNRWVPIIRNINILYNYIAIYPSIEEESKSWRFLKL